MSCLSRSWSNLECSRSRSETAPLTEDFKHPVGIRRSCGVIAPWITPEGLTAQSAVDGRFFHSCAFCTATTDGYQEEFEGRPPVPASADVLYSTTQIRSASDPHSRI